MNVNELEKRKELRCKLTKGKVSLSSESKSGLVMVYGSLN
jgi:hypothetical protein